MRKSFLQCARNESRGAPVRIKSAFETPSGRWGNGGGPSGAHYAGDRGDSSTAMVAAQTSAPPIFIVRVLAKAEASD
jgi:hypothetical protein